MDFTDCLKGRRSVRRYTEEPVDRRLIERAVEAASFAPSWKNSQTVRYLLIENAEIRKDIAEHCVLGFSGNKAVLESAPALMLILSVCGRSGFERDGSFSTGKGTHWESFDAGVAASIFCCAAHELGLGTVIMGIYDEEKVRAAAAVPEGQSVAALIAVGHPAETPAMPKRKAVSDLLSWRE